MALNLSGHVCHECEKLCFEKVITCAAIINEVFHLLLIITIAKTLQDSNQLYKVLMVLCMLKRMGLGHCTGFGPFEVAAKLSPNVDTVH